MIYNALHKCINNELLCASCPYHNNRNNRCSGFNLCCYKMDETAHTVINPITNSPFTTTQLEQISLNLQNNNKEE